MSGPERAGVAAVPRRDAHGRVVSLPQLVAVVAAFTVVNAIGLVIIDALVAWIGSTSFGDSSGWLMMILPGLVYFDDIRGWKAYRIRFLVAIVAALVAIAVGMLAAGVASGLAPLVTGGIGAFVAVLAYAPVWFVGIRLLTGDSAEESANARRKT
jgi:hypothetical protein